MMNKPSVSDPTTSLGISLPEPPRDRITRSLAAGGVLMIVTLACRVGDASMGPEEPAATVVDVAPDSAEVVVGGSTTFSATVRDSAGNELSRPVDWTSSDPAVATVDNTGEATGESVGISYVIATSERVADSAYLYVNASPSDGSVALYGVFETSFEATGSYSNPYVEASMEVQFTGPSGQTVTVDGFWDGGSTWRVRFRPTEIGTWTWSSSSSDSGLDGESGQFEVGSAEGPAPVSESDTRTYTLERADGTPFFWLGDTDWELFTGANAWPDEFKSYVDDRDAKKFTVLQSTIEPTNCQTTGRELGHNEGGCAFTGGDWQSEDLNPGFFQNMDQRVQYVMDNTDMAIVFWLIWSGDWNSGFTGSTYDRWLEYLVARYAAYNVMFGVSGEYNEALTDTDANNKGTLLDDSVPYSTPVTIHPVGGTTGLNNSWMGFNQIQKQNEDAGTMSEEVAADRADGLPVVYSEGCYENRSDSSCNGTASDMRQQAWGAYVGGGFHTYGEVCVAVDSNCSDWTTRLDEPGAKDMTHIREFWDEGNRVPWESMTPDNSLVTSGTGYLSKEAGVQYVAYLPSGGSVDIDLSGASGTFDYDWFNPRDGTTTAGGTVDGGGTRSFSAPNTNDWVLYIH